MGRPVLLAVAAALLLVLPGAGAAVTRLRVSANFVSTGGGPGEAVESGGGGGGRHCAHPRLFAYRSAGPPVSSGGVGIGAGLRAPGLPPARGYRLLKGGGAPGLRGFPLPRGSRCRR